MYVKEDIIVYRVLFWLQHLLGTMLVSPVGVRDKCTFHTYLT